MASGNYYQILKRPVVSEKSYKLMDQGVYTFVVADSATKIDIRYAVEKLFNVSVTDVNTLIRKGKRRRNRKNGSFAKLSDEKRAMVKLAAGQSIEIFEK